MGSFSDFLADPFDFLAGWLQGHLLLPISGKKASKEAAAKKPSAKPHRKSA